MMWLGDYRPGFVCNGSDSNGNPCPLMKVPPALMEMLSQPESLSIFGPDGRRLRAPQSSTRHNMLPGAVMLLVPMYSDPTELNSPEPPVVNAKKRKEAKEEAKEEMEEGEDKGGEEGEEREDRGGEEGENKGGDEGGENEPEGEPEDLDLENEANQSVNFSSCAARFNGIGDIKQFLKEVLEFKEFNEMSDEAALQSIPLLFQGLVNDWWAERRQYITDWQCALKEFSNCYRIYPLQPKVFNRYFYPRQTDESTAAFVQKTRGVFRILPLPNFTEESQLDLVYAMLHSRITEKLSRADFKTFTELLERAQQVEEAIMASTPQGIPLPGASANPEEREALSTSPPLDQLPSGGEVFRSSCKYCLSYGDLLVTMCRKLHKGVNPSPELQLLEKMKQMDKEELRKMICFECQSPNIVGLKSLQIKPEISGNCPLINVRIYEKEFIFMVNTGINYSIASNDLVAHLLANGHQPALKILVTPLHNGGLTKQEEVRAVAVDVTVSEVKIPAVFVVITEKRGRIAKNVFGMDFMKKAGLVMDFRGAGAWAVRGTTEEQPVLYESISHR